ncbi:phosphatase PAP2 family protein [Nonlabens mediterrranea]|uniref:Phosphatase PAP2 family protein n=2 Tax=Nonlabens mediterrranea TaxID=1419947 RepID=A0ABS0A1T3_9FLAO|nr:phosphatase PAP2 family protein [Nonlabens mediterrranea]
MKKIIYGLCLLAAWTLSGQSNSNSFTQSNQSLWKDFTYDMGNVFQGVGYAYSRPIYWQQDDFYKLGATTAITLGLYSIDDQSRRYFVEHKENVPNLILDYGWYAGSPQNNYGATGAVYLTGLFTRNEKLRRTGVLLLSSATATGFLQQLTKSVTGRARPQTNLGKNHFKPFGGSAGYRSFPSGHAVLTFTNAHVIAKQFDSWWIKGPIYAIGVTPGLTRIYEEQHWASDVFLSWVLSYFVVESIDKYLDKKYEQKYNATSTDDLTSLNFTFTGNRIGVVYSF